eukprot:m.51538 g.51538  ORF g.51538 m.51538 type:complete len:580 (-) comp7316_c0_seq3:73-1812(-)
MRWLSHRQWTLLLRPEYISYGACGLFLTTLHNLFLLYHIELYVSHYQISERAFFWGSALFLVWNAINDFVLGWLSDGSLLQEGGGSGAALKGHDHGAATAANVRARRLRGLAVGGPLMGIAFMAMLFRWPVPLALQFVVTLCVYDAALTWVDLSHSALLAEMATGADERSTLNALSSIFSACGSISVFASFFFWDVDNLDSFRLFSVLVALGCAAGFRLCTYIIQQSTDVLPLPVTSKDTHSPPARGSGHGNKGMLSPGGPPPVPAGVSQRRRIVAYFTQMMTNTNLMWFTLLSLVQTFHCHFNSNFFPLILGVLLQDYLTPFEQSLLLGLSFLLPHLNNVYFSALVARIGSYSVIQGLLLMKLALGATMLALGPSSWIILSIFIASNRVFTEGCCKLLNLVVSDLIDEDAVVHKRETSISALIFGTTNLFTKPGQSLAPLIGTYYIARHCNGFIFSPSKVLVGHELEKIQPDSMDGDEVKQALFTLVVWVPIASSLIQLVAWSRYRLHGQRLESVRAQMLETRTSYRHGRDEKRATSTPPVSVGPSPTRATSTLVMSPAGGAASLRSGHRRVIGSFDL